MVILTPIKITKSVLHVAAHGGPDNIFAAGNPSQPPELVSQSDISRERYHGLQTLHESRLAEFRDFVALIVTGTKNPVNPTLGVVIFPVHMSEFLLLPRTQLIPSIIHHRGRIIGRERIRIISSALDILVLTSEELDQLIHAGEGFPFTLPQNRKILRLLVIITSNHIAVRNVNRKSEHNLNSS
jgi:hypothetical protein